MSLFSWDTHMCVSQEYFGYKIGNICIYGPALVVGQDKPLI